MDYNRSSNATFIGEHRAGSRDLNEETFSIMGKTPLSTNSGGQNGKISGRSFGGDSASGTLLLGNIGGINNTATTNQYKDFCMHSLHTNQD